jgi:hypothetical protein
MRQNEQCFKTLKETSQYLNSIGRRRLNIVAGITIRVFDGDRLFRLTPSARATSTEIEARIRLLEIIIPVFKKRKTIQTSMCVLKVIEIRTSQHVPETLWTRNQTATIIQEKTKTRTYQTAGDVVWSPWQFAIVSAQTLTYLSTMKKKSLTR